MNETATKPVKRRGRPPKNTTEPKKESDVGPTSVQYDVPRCATCQHKMVPTDGSTMMCTLKPVWVRIGPDHYCGQYRLHKGM